MTFLFSDGFDFYRSGTTVVDSTRYSQATLFTVNNSVTQYGVGNSLLGSSSGVLTAPFETGTNETTIYFSFRLNMATLSGIYPNTGQGFYLTFKDGTNSQVTVKINGTNTYLLDVIVTSGDAGGSVIASATSVAKVSFGGQTYWNSYQGKIVISDTNGSVEIRMNGSSTPILSVTGTNTQAGSANSYANAFTFTSSVSVAVNQTTYLDDVWMNNGDSTIPNTWPKDRRSIILRPASNVSTQLTPSPVVMTNPLGSLTTVGTGLLSANIMAFNVIVPSVTGTISSFSTTLLNNFTGNIKAAIYGDNGIAGKVVGVLLGQTNATTSASTGTLTFTFTSPIVVSRGRRYWVCILTDTDVNFLSYTNTITLETNSASPRRNYASSYAAGFININGQTTSFGSTTPRIILSVPIDPTGYNYSSLSDFYGLDTWQQSFVSPPANTSSVVGNADIYGIGSLPNSVLGNISGLRLFAYSQKSDAGKRSIVIGIDANNSGDTPQITYLQSASEALVSKMLPTDPIGAAWTVSNVNNAKISVKVQ